MTPSPPTAAEEPLQRALAGEHAAVWAYAALAALLPADRSPEALEALAAHRQARDAVEDLLRTRAIVPVAAEPAYASPPAPPAVAADRVEKRLAAAYAFVLSAAAEPEDVGLAAEQLRACAVRAALWTGATAAFPGLPGRG